MIARYKNRYFCIDKTITPAHIWAYIPVDGFEKKTTRRGTVYYENFVDINEIEEIFNVSFVVEWNGFWFNADYISSSQKARLFSLDFEAIEKFNMNEFERGAWDLYVDIDSCNEFKVIYEDCRTGESTPQIVSKEEWIVLWNKLIVELLPN